MPRGISSERNRPITSPWPSVFTSSPGITIRPRSRASSTASSAPPNTLWSVTAIAPSHRSSAASSTSSTSTAQSCDHDVWRWRSQRIQSRSASGSAGRGRRRRVERPAYRSSSSAATSAKVLPSTLSRAWSESCRRSGSFSARRASAAAASSGLLVHPRRRGDRGARGSGLERDAGKAVERGDEDRGLVEDRSAAAPVASGAHVRTAAQLRRNCRPPCELLRAQEDELPVGQLAQRADDGARERTFPGPPLEHDELPLRCRLEELGVDALFDDPVLAGEALSGRVCGIRRGCDERVDATEQALALGAPPAGSRGAPARRSSPPSARARREARVRRGSAGPARSRARRRILRGRAPS